MRKVRAPAESDDGNGRRIVLPRARPRRGRLAWSLRAAIEDRSWTRPDRRHTSPLLEVCRWERHAARHAKPSPSTAADLPKLASQMRVAFSSMASNTGFSSAGERADHLEHVRGRGLLLQRLGELARARLNLVESAARVSAREVRLLGQRALSPLVPVRTKLATARLALRAFAGQGHLGGTSSPRLSWPPTSKHNTAGTAVVRPYTRCHERKLDRPGRPRSLSAKRRIR